MSSFLSSFFFFFYLFVYSYPQPILTNIKIGDTVYTQWNENNNNDEEETEKDTTNAPYIECQILSNNIDGMYQIRKTSSSSSSSSSSSNTKWKMFKDLISIAKGPALKVEVGLNYYIMARSSKYNGESNGKSNGGIVLHVGTIVKERKEEKEFLVDLILKENTNNKKNKKKTKKKRMIVSREFVYNMHRDTLGGTFLLDSKLVASVRNTIALQHLVLFQDLMDSYDIPFWISGQR